jgi:hypothetical protein
LQYACDAQQKCLRRASKIMQTSGHPTFQHSFVCFLCRIHGLWVATRAYETASGYA